MLWEMDVGLTYFDEVDTDIPAPWEGILKLLEISGIFFEALGPTVPVDCDKIKFGYILKSGEILIDV
jgi:hypothetical protein